VSRCEARLYISCFLLITKTVMTPKVTSTLRQVCRVQGNFKCIQEASSEDGVIWVCHIDHIKSDAFSAGFLGVPKDTGSVIALTDSILFPLKP
jgi:hypothetical protein